MGYIKKDFNNLLLGNLKEKLDFLKSTQSNYLKSLKSEHNALNPLEISHDTARLEAEVETFESTIILCEKEAKNGSLAVHLEFLTSGEITKLAEERKKYFLDSETSDADEEEMAKRGKINGQFIANNDIRLAAYEISVSEAKENVILRDNSKRKQGK